MGMHYVRHFLLLIVCLGNLVACQSQRTNIASHGLYSSISISCSSGNCRQRTTIIAGSILGGGTAIILLLIVILLCCNRCKGRPLEPNVKFVHSSKHKNDPDNSYGISLFQSGLWSSRYVQYGIWHGVYHLILSFDPHLMKVSGSGSDHVGVFTIQGTYSLDTGRIGLTKTYPLATSKRSEGARYQPVIQLTWNSETRQFEGKWYARTKTCREEDKFELKFSKQQFVSCETV